MYRNNPEYKTACNDIENNNTGILPEGHMSKISSFFL